MAHYVAKILKIRPSDILNHWGVCELIVAYGEYRNEEQYKNYLEIKQLYSNDNSKPPIPSIYAVKFMGDDYNETLEDEVVKNIQERKEEG